MPNLNNDGQLAAMLVARRKKRWLRQRGGGPSNKGVALVRRPFPGSLPPKVRMVKEHPRAGFGAWVKPLRESDYQYCFCQHRNEEFYIALSYCWGDGKTNKEIYLHRKIPVNARQAQRHERRIHLV
jgi:hypothetical protein